MEYPKTRKEARETGATHYYTGEPCSRGHIALRKLKGVCVECMKEDWAVDNAKRAAKPKSEAAKAAAKRYYDNNKELVKLKALGRSNEDRRRYRNAWKDRNPLEVKASTKHRRDKHKQATPKWLTLEHKAAIKKLYIDAMTVSKITGVPYVVDHIVPLRGQDVCGLHVPWNLQVMSREENLKKSNKLLANAKE
jgi:5-methylcytosine-specific restriction endonuclease McrA